MITQEHKATVTINVLKMNDKLQEIERNVAEMNGHMRSIAMSLQLLVAAKRLERQQQQSQRRQQWQGGT